MNMERHKDVVEGDTFIGKFIGGVSWSTPRVLHTHFLLNNRRYVNCFRVLSLWWIVSSASFLVVQYGSKLGELSKVTRSNPPSSHRCTVSYFNHTLCLRDHLLFKLRGPIYPVDSLLLSSWPGTGFWIFGGPVRKCYSGCFGEESSVCCPKNKK